MFPRRIHPIAVLAGIVSFLAGVMLVAVSSEVDGVRWPGVGLAVGGLAILWIAWWGISRSRREVDAVGSEKAPAYVPGAWYAAVLLGLFALLVVFLKVGWR
jgi:hypothetical protein